MNVFGAGLSNGGAWRDSCPDSGTSARQPMKRTRVFGVYEEAARLEQGRVAAHADVPRRRMVFARPTEDDVRCGEPAPPSEMTEALETERVTENVEPAVDESPVENVEPVEDVEPAEDEPPVVDEPLLPNPLDAPPTEDLVYLLDNKVQEFGLLGYGHVTRTDLWEYFKRLRKRRPGNLHELVNGILCLQPQAFMNFTLQQSYRAPAIRMEDFRMEDFQMEDFQMDCFSPTEDGAD